MRQFFVVLLLPQRMQQAPTVRRLVFLPRGAHRRRTRRLDVARRRAAHLHSVTDSADQVLDATQAVGVAKCLQVPVAAPKKLDGTTGPCDEGPSSTSRWRPEGSEL